MCYASVNAGSVVENVTRMKRGIIISVGVGVKIQKNIVCAKESSFETLQHAAVKMVNI